MDPIVNQAAAAVGNAASSAAGDAAVAPAAVTPKDGASQFDRIRAQLQQTADSLGIQWPQTTATPQPVQSAVGMRSATGSTPAVGAKPDKAKIERNLEVSRYHIERIRDEIKADPSVGTLQKTITSKLTSIENQYNQLDVAMSQVSPDASPQQWLRLQQMANSMNENINVLSKLVDSAASGVKTILQTQI